MLHLRSASNVSIVAILIATSCVPEGELGPFPETLEGGSVVVVIFPKEASKDSITYAVDTSAAPSFALTLPASFTAYALIYSCNLESLGILPGIQRPNAGVASGRPLPGTRRIYETTVTSAKSDGWRRHSGIPPSLLEVELPQEAATTKCFTFMANSIPTAFRLNGLAVALDRDSAVVASVDGDFYELHANGDVVPLAHLSTSTPHSAAFRTSDGEVWVFGPQGALARGTFDAGFTSLPPAPLQQGSRLAWLDGNGSGESIELFALSDQATFDRFDGAASAWTRIANGARPILAPFLGAVLWLDRGEAIAVGADTSATPGLVHYRNGDVTMERPPAIESGGTVTGLAEVPSLGVVVSSNRGTIEAMNAGNWTEVINLGTNTPLQCLLPYRDGFVVGGADESIRQYLGRSEELCTAVPLNTGSILRIAPLVEDRFLVLSSASPGDTATFVQGFPPYPDCEGLLTLQDLATQ